MDGLLTQTPRPNPSLFSGALSYTIIYNLLNFPAGVVPVSTVTAEDEEELRHYKGNYGDLLDKLYRKVQSKSQTHSSS